MTFRQPKKSCSMKHSSPRKFSSEYFILNGFKNHTACLNTTTSPSTRTSVIFNIFEEGRTNINFAIRD